MAITTVHMLRNATTVAIATRDKACTGRPILLGQAVVAGVLHLCERRRAAHARNIHSKTPRGASADIGPSGLSTRHETGANLRRCAARCHCKYLKLLQGEFLEFHRFERHVAKQEQHREAVLHQHQCIREFKREHRRLVAHDHREAGAEQYAEPE